MDPGNALWLRVSEDIECRGLIEPRQEVAGANQENELFVNTERVKSVQQELAVTGSL